MADGLVLEQLGKQKYNLSTISSYLVLLLDEQNIEVYHEDSGQVITLNANEGWKFIEDWALDNNFSLSRRKSRRAQIEHLLADLSNRQKLEDEAASSLGAILRQARETPPPPVRSAMSESLQKAIDLQRDQINKLNSRLFDPLYRAYYSSPLLAHIKDEGLRRQAALTLAGNPALAASYNGQQDAFGRVNSISNINHIHHLLRQTIPELEPFYQELRSDQFERDAESALQSAQNKLAEVYQGKSQSGIDLSKLDSDIELFRNIALSTASFTSLEQVIKALPDSFLVGSPNEREQLIVDIRKIVMAASSGPHLSGEVLIQQLVKEGKLPVGAADQLISFLAPQLEILEVAARTEIVRASVSDRRRNRELWTQGIAESLGLNASVFWLKEKDLQDSSDHFKKLLNVPDLESGLSKALEKGDLNTYQQLTFLIDRQHQYDLYRQYRGSSTLVLAQDLLSKFNYHYRIIKEPVDIANKRIWSRVYKIDDIIHFPARTVADFLENLQDGKFVVGKFTRSIPTVFHIGRVRIRILDPVGTMFSLYGLAQKNLAIRTFKWSYGLAQKGILPGLFRPISNYAFTFAQHDGFRETNFYFGRKLAGNFLNWGAKQLGYTSWTAVKTSAKQALWRVGNKVTGGLLAKGAAYLTSLGLSAEGIGIITTIALVAWDLIKLAIGSIKRFFKDAKFRDKILNLIPVTVGLGVGFWGIVQGVPAAIGLGFLVLIGFLGTALSGFVLLFSQAVLWAGAITLGVLLFFNLFKITTQIDPGIEAQKIINAYQCKAGDDSTKPPPGSILYSDNGQYAFPVSGAPGYGCYHWDGTLAADIFTGQAKSTDPQVNLPVLAYESGVIENVVNNDSLGGRYIIMRGTTSGRYYYYAHNCSIFVNIGDTVSVGDVIATTDQSGLNAAVTPEHLHFAISSGDNFVGGGTVCPQRDFFEKFSSLKDRCLQNMCVPGVPN